MGREHRQRVTRLVRGALVPPALAAAAFLAVVYSGAVDVGADETHLPSVGWAPATFSPGLNPSPPKLWESEREPEEV